MYSTVCETTIKRLQQFLTTTDVLLHWCSDYVVMAYLKKTTEILDVPVSAT